MIGILLKTQSLTISLFQQGSKKSIRQFTSNIALRFPYFKWIRRLSPRLLLKTIWPTTRGTLKNLFAWSSRFYFTQENLMLKMAPRLKSFGCVSFSLLAVKTSGLSHVRFTTSLNQTTLIWLSVDIGVSLNTFLISLFQSLAILFQQTITSQLTSLYSTMCTTRDCNATKLLIPAAQSWNLDALLWTTAQTTASAMQTPHASAIQASKALTALLKLSILMRRLLGINEMSMGQLGHTYRLINLQEKSESAPNFRPTSMLKKASTATLTNSTTTWLSLASLTPP